ncbi:STAS domain-containing protein [Streptomyces sp. NPDC048330]|uniref:STAS domain-containing protein n=1 Tax=Streptomyces sp. NPDC048330 TaxID=3365533 RepID=UPI00371D1F3A
MSHSTEVPVLSASAMGGHTYSAPGGTGVHRRATRLDGAALLYAIGEFDVGSVACLRQALADAHDDQATSIRLDLTGVTFGDAAFLDTLVHTRQGPGRLILLGPVPPPIRRLLDLTRTTHLFHFAA